MKSIPIRNVAVLGCAMVLGCGGDSGTAPVVLRPITVVSGADVSDTVRTRLLQALIVEVRVNGVLKPGAVVRFDALPTRDPLRGYESAVLVSTLTSNQYTSFVADSTDASGRARVLVQLGTIAGSTGVAITVPEIGLVDTARFTVLPGNAGRIAMKVRDTSVVVGVSYSIGASVADVFGNARTEAPTFTSLTPYSTVDATGVVKATSAGRAVIAVKSGTFADTSRVSIIPDATIVGATIILGKVSIATTKLDGTGLTPLTSVVSSVMLPHFNPAGTRVVFYEGDPNSNAQLYSVDLAGTRTLITVGAGPTTKYFPTYSADGQQLFFTGISGSYTADVWRSQADGSGVTKLTSSTSGTSAEPSPSPDGTKVVFNSDGLISTVDIATRTVKSLGVRGNFPSYSPDGTKILFLSQATYGELNLAVMNADGSNVRILAARRYDLYSGPSWSPDGTWIIIQSYTSLELVRASNFEILPLANLKFYQASFKP